MRKVRATAVQVAIHDWQILVERLSELENAPDDPFEEAMRREETAYRQLHYQLWPAYAGQHVAIYHGQLVDSDVDSAALYKRITELYGDEFVFITQVNHDPIAKVHVYSGYWG